MDSDAETLFEMMLASDRFCSEIGSAIEDLAPSRDQEDLRLKIAQCRALLQQLRVSYDEDKLTPENAAVLGHFRQLILALIWVAYHARENITFKQFRMLVMIESGFTYLLITRQRKAD